MLRRGDCTQFRAALADIEKNPVSWGSSDLSAMDLPEFDETFKKKWAARVEEHETPKFERISCRQLCYQFKDGQKRWLTMEKYERYRRQGYGRRTGQCLAFLGKAAKKEEDNLKEMLEDGWLPPCLTCPDCNGLSCSICGSAMNEDKEEHDCDPKKLREEPDIEESMVRGVDYQRCPNERCMKIWSQKEGRNAMVCDCVSPGLSR
jgi:hypothetical protein